VLCINFSADRQFSASKTPTSYSCKTLWASFADDLAGQENIDRQFGLTSLDCNSRQTIIVETSYHGKTGRHRKAKRVGKIKFEAMKFIKHLLIISLLFICQNIFAQNMTQQQWNKIRDEAFLEFTQNGGTTQQWQYNSEKIVQDYYKIKYTTNNSGEVKRQQSYVKGTFVSNNGTVGSFKNGYVLNSMGQTLGYLSQGYFMNSQQQCVGYVSGGQILSCNGNIIAIVKSDGVYNPQGYLVYALKGETLYSQNYPVLQISGIDMSSLAAYLLFFK
jgi:hypothetical protein